MKRAYVPGTVCTKCVKNNGTPEPFKSIGNSKMQIVMFDKSIIYKIVGNLESDPEKGFISIQTPIAQGLLGKNEGDEVLISTPSGDICLEIEKVRHI